MVAKASPCASNGHKARGQTLRDPDPLIAHFQEQATWCRALGSPFTAALLDCFAHDFAASGPVHTLCADWPGHPRRDALGLRLCGALHYGVLSGAAPDLARLYPAQRPDWDITDVWPQARAWLRSHLEPVSHFIQHPPQTNETGRALALLPGFLKIAALCESPLHLLELGASAGLNQNWDRFSYKTSTWQRRGTSDVELSADWRGPPPDHLEATIQIASRAACDLNPIDLNQATSRLRLKAYTWPDQTARLTRLDAAMDLARQTGVQVDQARAADWLKTRLAARPDQGATVVYHSVFLIYPPREEIAEIMARIAEAGAEATRAAPVAWLCYESEALFGGRRDSPHMQARLQIWPEGVSEVYAIGDGHVTSIHRCQDGTA